MSPSTMDFVVRESDMVGSRLDSLCRFVLILCGFEGRSAGEAARLLGISEQATKIAYCSALESLEVVYCQAVLDSHGCAVA